MKKLLSIIALVAVASFALGQGVRDIRINEILVKNNTSFTDDHSEHSSWIEIYNSGYSYVSIGGTRLRFIQGNDTVVYRIPKTDIRTNIAPQGYLLFYASGSSNKGTFHTNFELNETDSVELAKLVGINDRLEFLDQGGNLVDAIEYDVNVQKEDVSYGRILDDASGEIVISELVGVTPMQSNEIHEKIPKSELFRQEDPSGTAMSIVAMSVVFTALLCLYGIFRTLGKFMHSQNSKKIAKSNAPTPVAVAKPKNADDVNGEILAAIAMALNSYYDDLHDLESEIVTINRVARVYSPWSSKIHTMTKNPRA